MKFPDLVRALYWSSDAASALVLGELAPGDGTVEIPRFGWWTSLWWLLATRDLPGHEQIWEATGYVFAIATVVCVGWATARVAGRWAGATAAAIAVVVGPKALRSLLTVNFHVSTPFTAAVLAAHLVILGHRRSRLLAVAVGLLAGVNAASDPLLWIAGVLPFAVGAGVLAVATRRRDIAGRAAIALAVAGVSAFVTDRVMYALGYQVLGVGVEFADIGDLVPNFIKLGKSIAQLFGAEHFFPGLYPSEPIRYAITLLAFAAVGATLLVAVRLTARRAEPPAWAVACYWATGAIFLGLGFVLTNQGTGVGPEGGVNYLLTLAPAAGVGVVLLASRSSRGRLAVSLAVAAVGAVNIVSIAQGHAERRPDALQRHADQIVRLLEGQGVTRGYAQFWDSQSLTWQSDMRLFVSPVEHCDPPNRQHLCTVRFFTITSWYDERPGPSFLILDPERGLTRPPPTVTPSSSHRFGPLTIHVFDHDLARHIRSFRPS